MAAMISDYFTLSKICLLGMKRTTCQIRVCEAIAPLAVPCFAPL